MKNISFLLVGLLFTALCVSCSKDNNSIEGDNDGNKSSGIVGSWKISYYEEWYEKSGDTNAYEKKRFNPGDSSHDLNYHEFLFGSDGKGVYKEYDNNGLLEDSEDIIYTYQDGELVIIYSPGYDQDIESYVVDRLSGNDLILKDKSECYSEYDYRVIRIIYNRLK